MNATLQIIAIYSRTHQCTTKSKSLETELLSTGRECGIENNRSTYLCLWFYLCALLKSSLPQKLPAFCGEEATLMKSWWKDCICTEGVCNLNFKKFSPGEGFGKFDRPHSSSLSLLLPLPAFLSLCLSCPYVNPFWEKGCGEVQI